MTHSGPPPAQISPPPSENKVPAPGHWNPSWYVEGSSFQRDIVFEVLTHLDLSAAHRILDLGCGDGMITRRVAILNPQAKVRGLDLSKDMVDFAKAAHRGVPNLEFIQDDIQTFRLDETYDFILSCWTLSWLKDHSAGARQIKAALTKGGGLYLMAPMTNLLIFETLATLLVSQPWKERLKHIANPSSSVTLAMYQGLYSGPGMDGVKVRKELFSYSFRNTEALIAYMRGWLPHAKHLSELERERFMKEFVLLYNRRSVESGVPMSTVSFDCVIVERLANANP